ncbi:hypothetical protein [Nonomuraea endophytica]|uniref:hypothetical protein n=1 Tax=Nonomuraea endophytica TaxID=714136 RepID=UPI0037C8EB0A
MRGIIVTVVLACAVAGCSAPAGEGAGPDVPRVVSTDVAVGKEITITAAGPVPRHLIAGPGDRITWRNTTSGDQTVTLADGTSSGAIGPGQVFTREFPTSGSFTYKLGTASGLVEINLPEPSAGS